MSSHLTSPRLAALGALAAILAGPALAEVKPGGTAIYAADVEPTNIDPHSTGEIVADPIIRAVFDTLVNQALDGSFEPWLAREWEVSEDGLHYRFVLRDDVTFHDGTPFNADAIVANVAHVLSRRPGVNSRIVSVLDKENPVTVLGEHEVVLNLTTRSVGFLNQLANIGFAIVAPSALAEHADTIASGAGYVGTGPFRLVSRSIGTNFVFERNPDYAWAPPSIDHGGPAYLDGFEIRFLPEIQARIGALTSGQVQGAANIPPTLVPVVEASAAITSQETAGTSYALWLNSESGAFADLRVRRAFQRSLDIDTLIASIYRGAFDRAWSISSPLLPDAFDPALVGAWPQDLELAAKLLAEAGYTDKDSEGYWVKDGQRLSLVWNYNASAIREQRDVLGDAIVDEARKAGFQITRVPFDAGAYLEERKKNEYDILDINSFNPDPDTLRAPFFHSSALPRNGGIYNFSNVDSPELDALLVAANSTPVPAERWELYSKIQNYVVLEEALVVPLYTSKFILGHTRDSDGWYVGLRGVPLNFYNVHYTGK